MLCSNRGARIARQAGWRSRRAPIGERLVVIKPRSRSVPRWTAGPDGHFGRLESFELLQVNRLPGTARYFRMLYMSHHTSAPVMWEFRYYVRPDKRLGLNRVTWTDRNPFRVLARAESGPSGETTNTFPVIPIRPETSGGQR